MHVPSVPPMTAMLAGPQLQCGGDLHEGWPLGPQDLPSLQVQMGPGTADPDLGLSPPTSQEFHHPLSKPTFQHHCPADPAAQAQTDVCFFKLQFAF